MNIDIFGDPYFLPKETVTIIMKRSYCNKRPETVRLYRTA